MALRGATLSFQLLLSLCLFQPLRWPDMWNLRHPIVVGSTGGFHGRLCNGSESFQLQRDGIEAGAWNVFLEGSGACDELWGVKYKLVLTC